MHFRTSLWHRSETKKMFFYNSKNNFHTCTLEMFQRVCGWLNPVFFCSYRSQSASQWSFCSPSWNFRGTGCLERAGGSTWCRNFTAYCCVVLLREMESGRKDKLSPVCVCTHTHSHSEEYFFDTFVHCLNSWWSGDYMKELGGKSLQEVWSECWGHLWSCTPPLRNSYRTFQDTCTCVYERERQSNQLVLHLLSFSLVWEYISYLY